MTKTRARARARTRTKTRTMAITMTMTMTIMIRTRKTGTRTRKTNVTIAQKRSVAMTGMTKSMTASIRKIKGCKTMTKNMAMATPSASSYGRDGWK